ncbi:MULTISPECIES: low-specificity L-threonine aldolase [unclassified Ruegeria]|uniref:low-specificity L-threonine aldolase n=1 Tax=unclassified Ruegeria TaxID=2625375 RepID=UPI001488D87D|nr:MULTISPECIES: low-specificity L-threonine aldolase [unclassified Ruegeria]NOD77652.1 low-specificity L-threonine aldolase [Ruegeria sp. HKCCD4332]NOD89859.1 low-specificity L-threonine aldolase [Ruegeria sp. HKCCD4318]NOE14695.1 low-specificity L-threonine aldolase [Ruegeria sp. HKCCD4318-2]NOG10951.1 low-specificity L-threonine aldolase [Ruegeria sp. HKCCD4315]
MSLYGYVAADAGTNCICDLRSDTLTQPSARMREAMMSAPLGDDVYGEDSTVARLEQELAARLGKDAAVFFPTGTQSNLAAVMAHCERGDEMIVGDRYHLYCDEAAGVSVLAGVSMNPVSVSDDGGVDADKIVAAIKVDDPHYARSRLLSLENSVGGRVVPLDRIDAGVKVARDAGLAVHLDGARLFNAITALGCDAATLAAPFDTVSVCLSKGLGAPAGSVLVGPSEMMGQIRRNRKILGGAMRQSGMLAAAGLYALEHHVQELGGDHVRAARLAKALRETEIGEVTSQTNMVFLSPEPKDHAHLIAHMAGSGIKIGGQSPAIRMVLHRDVDDSALDAAICAFQSFQPT